MRETGVTEVTIGGGVSANSGLRNGLTEMAEKHGWKLHLPPFAFTTDNAAMVAIAGHYKYIKNDFAAYDLAPFSRATI